MSKGTQNENKTYWIIERCILQIGSVEQQRKGFPVHITEPLGPSLVASAQGVKDFTKARGKAKIKFYSVSQGGKGPDTRDSIGHVG
jgi:hypothetical protein